MYDPSTNEMIVFGGRDSSGNNLNDVWILTNANGQGGASAWVNLIPNGADGAPPARSGHSAVYDTANNRMMIFGGCSGYCAPALNDVWVLTNANGQGGTPVWTEISSNSGPAARTNAAVVYDPTSNWLIVFGGQDGSPNPCSTYSDLWALTNANGLGNPPIWQKPLVSGPGSNFPGQNGPAATYDTTTQRMTLFGGTGMVNGSCQATDAVWQVVPGPFVAQWQIDIPEGAAGSPPARYLHSGVYDAAGGRMLIFGGSDGNGNYFHDVWSLSNATGIGSPAWTQLHPTGGPPPARGSQAAVFDSTNQLMTIFGGNSSSEFYNDTWVLSAPGISGLSCRVNSAPNIVRAEGLAERLGDTILQCTGGTPTPAGEPIPQYTVTLQLNTNVTSRPLAQRGKLSEALLTIDEPFPQSPIPSDQTPFAQQPPQILCTPLGKVCSETGTGGSPSPYQSEPNVFVGKQTSATTLQWTVPIDPPGVNLVRTLRLSNLRVNAVQLDPRPVFTPIQVFGAVTVAGSQPVPVGGSPLALGVVQPGATASASEAPAIPQCKPHNASLEGGSGTAAFDVNVQVQEGFSYSFLVRNYGSILFGAVYPPDISEQNVPGFEYRTETAFYLPSLLTAAPDIGLADSGTRIVLKFGSVQTGVHLFVPVSIATQPFMGEFFGMPGQLQLVEPNVSGGSAGYVPVQATAMVGSTPVAEVRRSGAKVSATYEVVYSDPAVAETATIPVAIAFRQTPGVGATTVDAFLGPRSTVGTAVESAPVPRFGGMTAVQPAYSIYSCPTTALTGKVESKTGPLSARVWTIGVTGGATAASAAQIEGFTLTQYAGATCTPAVTSPASFPISLGDIPANHTATGQVTIDFSSCASDATFRARIPLSADQGNWTGIFQTKIQKP